MSKSSHKLMKGALSALYAVQNAPSVNISSKEETLATEEKKVISMFSEEPVALVVAEPDIEEPEQPNLEEELVQDQQDSTYQKPVKSTPFLGQYRRIGGFPPDERW